MLRSHIGFALFMLLLLIAPKIPLKVPGGIERSAISLGLAGLIIWFFAYPKKLFCFPRISISHPLSWLIIFAVYALVVSLLSGSLVSIAYSAQFLAYAILGTVLMRRYASMYIRNGCRNATLIFFGIAVVYAIGILISLFAGPIYPHQVPRHKIWEGFNIQRGLGFSENPNMAGAVIIFFAFACIYMYQGKRWKKWILLCLILSALLATVSRSAIISFIAALGLVYCFDSFEPFIRRGCVKVLVLKNVVFVALALSFVVAIFFLAVYTVNKSVLIAILSGFGLADLGGSMPSDMGARLDLWLRGLNTWASGSLLEMIFGGGFRSSMVIDADRGMWKDAHNVYIAILGDFGIIGLTLFLVALFCAFFRYIHLFLNDKAKRIEQFGLTVLLALSIHNMTEVFFYSPVCLSLLILTFAITL